MHNISSLFVNLNIWQVPTCVPSHMTGSTQASDHPLYMPHREAGEFYIASTVQESTCIEFGGGDRPG